MCAVLDPIHSTVPLSLLGVCAILALELRHRKSLSTLSRLSSIESIRYVGEISGSPVREGGAGKSGNRESWEREDPLLPDVGPIMLHI